MSKRGVVTVVGLAIGAAILAGLLKDSPPEQPTCLQSVSSGLGITVIRTHCVLYELDSTLILIPADSPVENLLRNF